jgi:hypothetical protein
MSKLYACLLLSSPPYEGGVAAASADRVVLPSNAREIRKKESFGLGTHHSSLITIAEQFSYRIETIDGGILFDVSGLENRIGSPTQIAESIVNEMQSRGLDGSLAIAANASTAELYARSRRGVTVVGEDDYGALPLSALGIDQDTLKVFGALGLETTADLKNVPENDLVARYGLEFRRTLDLMNQRGTHILTPNLRERTVTWDYELDFPVEDFEQLIFILGHGLGKVLEEANTFGFSSEQIDVSLGLDNKTIVEYSIKLSFPTREKNFWLKLMNLRIGNDPPEAAILSMRLVCHFARPRALERGLFAATRPEPESLLLTVDKIKKIVGTENVGVPALVDQRLPEAFELDHEKLPVGKEVLEQKEQRPVLALTYFHPPIPADIKTADGRLLYVSTDHFAGRVTEYGGAWLQSSQWWTRAFWQRMEWDVEIDNRRIYRLARTMDGWFVTGGYD